MARSKGLLWPTGPRTLFFDDVASSATLSKAVAANRIRRLAPKTYSADLDSEPAEIILANRWPIVARLFPDAVIVDRSAAGDGLIPNGVLFIAATTSRKKVALPGLEIRIRPGGAFGQPVADLPWSQGLHMSSGARTLLDNLATTRGRRGHVPRTLSRAELEDWLANKAIAWGEVRIDRLRKEARELAAAQPEDHDLELLEALFAQLQGLKPPRRDAGERFKAFTSGMAWDTRRLELFNRVVDTLNDLPDDVPAHLAAPAEPGELPFYESYFSNYIEGTEFTLEEAREIIERQEPPADRPADGHDILGTYKVVVGPIGRAQSSSDADELVGYLCYRHRSILEGRPDMKPGEWKTKSNQAGTYVFVEPDLVEGTLRKGLAAIDRLAPGFARALYVMIVVTEIHPFADGNGRVARAMMNAELSAIGDARIVIPSVLRNEYISAVRKVSRTTGDVSAFLKVMVHAWRWTAVMPWGDRAATEGQLDATNALVDSTEAENQGLRLELP